MSGDPIDMLPTDSSVPSHGELKILDTLFKSKVSTTTKFIREAKDLVIIAGLFVIFSLPVIDETIKKFVTVTENSPYILLLTKAILFTITFFVIKNIYLVKKEI